MSPIGNSSGNGIRFSCRASLYTMDFSARQLPRWMGGIFGSGKFITLGPTNATAVLLFGAFAGAGLIGQNGLAVSSALLLLPIILFTSGLFLIAASLLRISFYRPICFEDCNYRIYYGCGLPHSSQSGPSCIRCNCY